MEYSVKLKWLNIYLAFINTIFVFIKDLNWFSIEFLHSFHHMHSIPGNEPKGLSSGKEKEISVVTELQLYRSPNIIKSLLPKGGGSVS